MKKLQLLLLAVFAFAAMQGFAYDFVVNLEEDVVSPGRSDLKGKLYVNEVYTIYSDYKSCEVTFESCEEIDGDTIYNVGNEVYKGFVYIPDLVRCNGEVYRIRGIGDHAFENCDELSKLSVEDSYVRYIGKYALKNCTTFKGFSYYLSDINEYREGAFENCISLKNLDLFFIEKIESRAFAGCRDIKFLPFGSMKTIKAANDAFDIEDGVIHHSLILGSKQDADYCNETEPWKYFKYIKCDENMEYPICDEDDETESSVPILNTQKENRIYTIDGKLIKGVNSLDQLPKGIYIQSGKKVIK